MESPDLKNNVLDKVELFATRIISNQMPEKIVFHNIIRTHSIIAAAKEIIAEESLTEEEKEIVLIAAWMINTGFKDANKYESDEPSMPSFFSYCHTCSESIGASFLKSINYPAEKREKVLQTIRNSGGYSGEKNQLEKILTDSIFGHLGKKGAKKELKLMYEENLLSGIISVGKGSWYETILGYLENHQYLTNFGKTKLEPKKQQLIERLRKEKKNIEKKADLLLKKELDISDSELKKLKKDLEKQQGRDDRGIQTMFRITSRNHYTLNVMVDRKANIMISVNSIILSLILGSLIGDRIVFEQKDILPLLIMSLTAITSVFYAVLAIRPAKTHGEFTEDEIRNKSGNLLFFGNFHDMHPRDFEWGMLQMLSDKNYLYSTMIRDFYYLGQTLERKYAFIRRSLNVFIFGLMLTVLVTMFLQFIYFWN